MKESVGTMLIEFCKRLSAQTGLEYKLPSEAQWEYACSCREQKPHFILEKRSLPDLLTIDGIDKITKDGTYSGSYRSGPKAKLNREQTTEVGYFPANVWGLLRYAR